MNRIEIGKSVFFRTVTMCYSGKLVAECPGVYFEIVEAAWVADTGRFGYAIATGDFSEVEAYPATTVVRVYVHCIVDACVIPHHPTDTK